MYNIMDNTPKKYDKLALASILRGHLLRIQVVAENLICYRDYTHEYAWNRANVIEAIRQLQQTCMVLSKL